MMPRDGALGETNTARSNVKMAKKTANKTASKPAPKKVSAASKTRTKSEIFATIADSTELSKKQVGSVFETLTAMVSADLKKGTIFTLPGMAKFTVRTKPASKAREGKNPFTGEKIMIKAKPASKVVRIRPLKALKSAV